MAWFATVLFAASLASGQSAAQAVLAEPGSTPPQANALVLAAGNVGVRRCLPALAELSSIGIRDAIRNDVLIDWDRRRPDGAPVFSLIGFENAKGNGAMSISAMPEADGTCSVGVLRTAYEPHPCRQVAERDLKGYKATRLIDHMMVYTRDDQPGSTVSLIDSAPGCLTLRRYVKFSMTSPAAGGARDAR